MEDRDQTFPHASLDPSESKVEGNELRKQDKAGKLKSRARERQMSSVTVDVLDGGNSWQLNAIESRCSAVKEKGKDGVCVCVCVCVCAPHVHRCMYTTDRNAEYTCAFYTVTIIVY